MFPSMDLLAGLLAGVAMGWLIQRAGASSPGAIARTLRLEDLSILKFMATAIAVAAVGIAALALVVPMHQAIKPLYVAGVLAGGLIFGVGFALAGFCPGTSVVAAAEGRRDALFAVAGGLAGAAAFTLAYPALAPTLMASWDLGRLTLADVTHLPPLAAAALLALALAVVVWRLPTRRCPPCSR